MSYTNRKRLVESTVVKDITEDVDLIKGTKLVKGLSSYVPRTPDEIIELLKIDTTVWQLERYWNKEKSNGLWLISALVGKIKVESADRLTEFLDNYTPKAYFPLISHSVINFNYSEPCVGVISLQDLHFGKKGNDDIKELFLAAIKNLVGRAYNNHRLEKIILVLGGDLLNMDTFNGTTTAGTLIENGMDAQDAFVLTMDKYIEAISYLAHYCDILDVVYIPGNHDRLSSHHLAVSISKIFAQNPKIQFDVKYEERKAYLYGVNMIGLEHGDTNMKLSPLVFATEFPKIWGNAEFRTIYIGHTHKKNTITYTIEDEQNGIDIKTLPSLCTTDYYHYHNKWTGNKRRGVMDIHGINSGFLDQIIFTPKLLEVNLV